jgi:3-hydroxy-3-methylglutaryl CoA synthase
MAYGSGSKSKVLAARITCAKEARLELKNRFQDAMNSRVKLGIEEYERIHRAY